MARLYKKLGDFDQAQEVSKSIKSSEIKTKVGGEIEEAKEAWEEAQRLFKEKKWQAAEKAAERLLTNMTPHFPNPLNLRISALVKLNHYERAISIAKSLEKDGDGEAQYLLAKVNFSLGRGAIGLKYLNKCFELDPDHKGVRALRSDYKRFDTVINDKDLTIKASIQALNELLSLIERVPEGKAYYDEYFPMLFESQRIPVMKTLCYKLVRSKSDEDALREAERVCAEVKALDNTNSEFYLMQQAELAMARGKYDDALILARKALESKPRDPELKALYKKVDEQRTQKMRTKYYDVLGIPQQADEDAIKKAYSRLVKRWHPDKHSGKDTMQEAEEKMQDINAAYDVLSDPKKRRMYDQGVDPNDPQGAAGGNPFAGGGFGGSSHGFYNGGGFGDAFGGIDLEEILKAAGAGGFGRGATGGGAGRGRGRGRRNAGSGFYFHEDL